MAKKVNKKLKIVIIVILSIVAVFILFAVWYVFCPKKYSIYSWGTDVMDTQYITVKLYGTNLDKKYRSEYIIEDAQNIKNIKKTFNELSFQPYLSKAEQYNEENRETWWLELHGKKEEYLNIHYLGEIVNEGQKVDFSILYHGIGTDNMFSLISETVLKKQQTMDSVTEALLQAIQDEISKITAEELLNLAENKDKEFTHFEKYYYQEDESRKDTVQNNSRANNVVKFEIDNTNLSLIVWYQNEIWQYGPKYTDSEKIMQIWKAEVWNEAGQSVDFYGDELYAFMEENK